MLKMKRICFSEKERKTAVFERIMEDNMVFYFRPCSRKARWRRRRLSAAAARLLAGIICLAAFVGLLFIAPQWVLVCAVVLLTLALIFLVQK